MGRGSQHARCADRRAAQPERQEKRSFMRDRNRRKSQLIYGDLEQARLQEVDGSCSLTTL